jgi:hypothetical protein
MSDKRPSCVNSFTKPQRCGPIENPSLQQWWLSRNNLRVANDMCGMKGWAVIARPWSPDASGSAEDEAGVGRPVMVLSPQQRSLLCCAVTTSAMVSDYGLRSGTGGVGSRCQHQAIPQLSAAMSLRSLGSWPSDWQWGGRAAAWGHRTDWVDLLLRRGDNRPGSLLDRFPPYAAG